MIPSSASSKRAQANWTSREHRNHKMCRAILLQAADHFYQPAPPVANSLIFCASLPISSSSCGSSRKSAQPPSSLYLLLHQPPSSKPTSRYCKHTRNPPTLSPSTAPRSKKTAPSKHTRGTSFPSTHSLPTRRAALDGHPVWASGKSDVKRFCTPPTTACTLRVWHGVSLSLR